MASTISFLYVSVISMADADRRQMLDHIEFSSRARNSSLNLTGILMVTKRYFTQILEGEEAAIDLVLGKITSDPRHKDIRMVWRRPIAVASFPTWKMVRFDTSHFGASTIVPMLATIHADPGSAAAMRLENLLETI